MSVKQVFNTSAELDYPTVLPTLDLDFANSKTLDSRITFTRASGGSYVGADGLIKYAGVNEPRFDHNPVTGESLGFLVEESRTNLMGLPVYGWSNYDSYTTPNTTIAPDGNSTAAKITVPTPGGAYRGVVTVFTPPSGGYFVYSIFVKSDSCTRIRLTESYSFGGGLVANLQTKKIETTFPNAYATSGGIIEYPNGWLRVYVVFNFPYASHNVWDLYLYGDNGVSVYAWGAQLEAGAFPTSYIPTEASSRTRATDTASITGTNFSSWYRQDEGTVFCQGISDSRSNSTYWTLQGASINGATVLVYPDNNITYQVVNSSIQVNTYAFATYSAVASVKTAAAIKLNNFAVVANGGSVTSDTSGTVPAVTSFVIGNYLGGGTSFDYSGTIARLTYYPVRLPDAQLQVLTT